MKLKKGDNVRIIGGIDHENFTPLMEKYIGRKAVVTIDTLNGCDDYVRLNIDNSNYAWCDKWLELDNHAQFSNIQDIDGVSYKVTYERIKSAIEEAFKVGDTLQNIITGSFSEVIYVSNTEFKVKFHNPEISNLSYSEGYIKYFKKIA